MYLIITSSPNTDGLTAACGQAAYEGITSANGKAEIIDISVAKLEPCKYAVMDGEDAVIPQSVLPTICLKNCRLKSAPQKVLFSSLQYIGDNRANA